MSIAQTRRSGRCPPCAVAAVCMTLSFDVSAGVFLNQTPGRVTHPETYDGTGGEIVLNVCLDPALPPQFGDPTQATANSVAEFNRFQGRLGNVVNALSVGAAGTDYESILLHEMGHCLGLDHNVLGPSELQCALATGSNPGTCPATPGLFYTNSFAGPNAVRQASPGNDNQRATGDDLRGDDINRHWHAIGANNPFEALGLVDRLTHSQTASLGDGESFAEAVTSFSPCNQIPAFSNTSGANGQPPTSDVVFPVHCINNVVRDLSPNDQTTFRIARAGLDGIAGTSDDYTTRLVFTGTQTDACHIRIAFPSGGGFSCQGLLVPFPNGDQRITQTTISLQKETGWFFNQTDTTADIPVPCVFRSGFENTPVACGG
jgi:hypothetical protein